MADPFSAWGPEQSGVRLAERDSIYNLMKGLESKKLLGEIAMQPAEQARLEADARYRGLQADTAKRKLDADARLEQMMSEGGQIEDPVQGLLDIANRAQRAGATGAATTALQRAAEAAENLSQGESARETAALNRLKQVQDINKSYANAMGTVTDQRSLDVANALFEQTYRVPAPLKIYSPEAVKAKRESLLTAKDRLDERIKLIEEGGRNTRASRRDAIAEEANRIREREVERREESDAARVKAGGTGRAAKPSTQDKLATRDFLKEYQPKLNVSGANGKAAVEVIASEAARLLRENPALSRAEAIQRAYEEETAAGSFFDQPQTIAGREIPFTGSRKFRSEGRTVDTALSVPSGDSTAVRKELKRNRIYNLGTRGYGRWNGTDFDEVSRGD